MTIREIALAVIAGTTPLDTLDPSTRKSVMVEMAVIAQEKPATVETK